MKSNVKLLFAGMLICFITIVSSIYISLKTGAGLVIDTVMLSMILLSLLRGFCKSNVVLTDIFARAAISGVTTVITYLGVLYIFEEPLNKLDILFFCSVVIVSGILGTSFFSGIEESLIGEEKYMFPQLKPRIELLRAVGADISGKIKMCFSFIAAGIYSLVVNLFQIIPPSVKYNEMFVFENSLVLISTGYFIGYRTYIVMGIGFLYSFFVSNIFHATSFSENILNPYIYSVVLGISLMQGVLTVWNMLITKKGNHLKWSKKSVYSIILLIVFYIMFVSKHSYINMQLPFWVHVIIIPVAIILSTSTMLSVAETGFWISALEDLIPIFLILMVQTTDMFSVIVEVSGLTAFEMCGIYYLLNCQVGRQFDVKSSVIEKYSYLSIILSGVVGIFAAIAIITSLGIGSNDLPAPGSQVFGMTLSGLMESIRNFQLPKYINIYVMLISCILCYLLNKTSVSAMVILSGMMLPFGTYVVIGIGALLSFVLKNNKKINGTVFSGVSVGDGLISSLIIVVKSIIEK